MNSTHTVFLHLYKDKFSVLILADCHSLNAMADLRFLIKITYFWFYNYNIYKTNIQFGCK